MAESVLSFTISAMQSIIANAADVCPDGKPFDNLIVTPSTVCNVVSGKFSAKKLLVVECRNKVLIHW